MYSIKNVKFHKAHQGMEGFNCDLYKNGIKVAYVYDDARGGGYDYTPITITKNDKSFCYGSLDLVLDELVGMVRMKKEKKKGVIVKAHQGYDIHAYKETIPTIIKKYKNGLEIIQKLYDKLILAGEDVLNTEYLESVGVDLLKPHSEILMNGRR